ncbi:transposable element Tc3 transposase [Trichonephila clavipes]|nr:transposable element Tc3 transposase [Trichonephila clavipes]
MGFDRFKRSRTLVESDQRYGKPQTAHNAVVVQMGENLGWRRVILESNRCLVAVHHRGCRERQYRVCPIDRKSPRKDLPTSVIALLPCDKIDRKMGAKNCQVIYSQFDLAIHQNDHQARRRFVEWAQNEIAVVPDFHKRILFIDEAHFWLNDYVNKQNCRIWSEANPHVYVETPLHPEKLTVWCALWAGGIIGRYFFKNDEGHNVTVNGDRYRAMITNFFIPELNNHDVQELWFQQDGATCHTARATIDLLKDTFGDRLISRFGPVNWPPRSCDLTPLDYFCGAM